MTAATEPNAQVLKYKLRNQSCCAEPEFTTNNQKHNSVWISDSIPAKIESCKFEPSRCVTLSKRNVSCCHKFTA